MPARRRKGKGSSQKAGDDDGPAATALTSSRSIGSAFKGDLTAEPPPTTSEDDDDRTVDLYGEAAPTAVSRARDLTRSILGSLVADALFGAAESPYRVPADYGRFESSHSNGSDSDGQAGSDHETSRTAELIAKAKERAAAATAAAATASTPAGDSAGTPAVTPTTSTATIAPPTGPADAMEAATARDVSAGEARAFAERLHAMCSLSDPPLSAVDAPNLARSLHLLCSQDAAAVGALANCCARLASTLSALEYELKRLKWKTPEAGVGPVSVPTELSALRSEAQSGALVAALVAAASSYAASQSSNARSSRSSVATEEVWVMDQLDAILLHSKTAPALFWDLLEERRLAVGLADPLLALVVDPLKEPLSGSAFASWTMVSFLCLTCLGSAWAVPALYQRGGSPFFVAACAGLEGPTLALGAALWKDKRTQRLGATFTTAAVALTPLTGLSLLSLGASLGFVPGHSRGWFPEPFALLDAAKFPHHRLRLAAGTGAVAASTFWLVADVPYLAAVVLASLWASVHSSPLLGWLVIRLNRAVLGPGKLGLKQADVWVDLGLSLCLLALALALLLFSWVTEAPRLVSRSAPATPQQLPRLDSSACSSASRLPQDHSRPSRRLTSGGQPRTPRPALGPTPSPAQSMAVGSGATQPQRASEELQSATSVAASSAAPKDHRWRHFLAVACDCCVMCAWVSFSRVDKEHSEVLEMVYGCFCALLVLLALLLRRRSLLSGVLGLAWYSAWYQGWRVVDVWSRSKHYAASVLLFDDVCVLVRCVDPLKSRPDQW